MLTRCEVLSPLLWNLVDELLEEIIDMSRVSIPEVSCQDNGVGSVNWLSMVVFFGWRKHKILK